MLGEGIMRVTEDDLGRLTEKVCTSILGLPLHAVPKTEATDQRISITARVRMSADDWNGALTLGCSELLAARIAVATHKNQTDLTTTRIEEAVGKVAELIAGELKAVSDRAYIVVPAIVCETCDVVPIGTRRIVCVSFGCYSQPLLVTLVERQ